VYVPVTHNTAFSVSITLQLRYCQV